MHKYIQMNNSSISSVDFTVRSLGEVVDIIGRQGV
jgi:hypothetical protein